jgi:hypothetical protein
MSNRIQLNSKLGRSESQFIQVFSLFYDSHYGKQIWKYIFLVLVFGLSISLAKGQVTNYKLKELYNFETEQGKNPFVEFAENREIKLTGGISEDGKEIIMIVNEDSGFISIDNPYDDGVRSYTILEKNRLSDDYVSFLMMGPNGLFTYIYSRQSPTVVNVYCFWIEADGRQLGYQSVVNTDRIGIE